MRGSVSVAVVAMAFACETSTTVSVAVRLAAPLRSGCVIQVATQSYGTQAVQRLGSTPSADPVPFHLGVDLTSRDGTTTAANVWQTNSPTGGVVLEVATVWWGTKPGELTKTAKIREMAFVREVLDKCAPADVAGAATMECTLTQGRGSKSGCVN
jgi:hypothetical protein